MMTLTLGFRGLCAFVERTPGVVDVLLNPTKGSHRPTLTVLTDYLDPEPVAAPSRWRPDFLGHIPTNDSLRPSIQIAVWDLTGVRVSFPGVRAATWEQQAKQNVIDFYKYHPTAKALRYPAAFGIVELGKCTIATNDLKYFKLSCESQAFQVATELRCSGLPPELLSARGIIQFCANTNPVAIVSNLSSHIDKSRPFHHFDNYYDVLMIGDKPIPDADRCKLEPAEPVNSRSCDSDNSGQPKTLTDEVYDCVPPTTSP